MRKFCVTVASTVTRHYTIKAESADDAKRMVQTGDIQASRVDTREMMDVCDSAGTAIGILEGDA